MISQLLRPSEFHSSGHCRRSSGRGSFANKLSLEFGNPGENSHDHFAASRCRVSPGFRNRLKLGYAAKTKNSTVFEFLNGSTKPFLIAEICPKSIFTTEPEILLCQSELSFNKVLLCRLCFVHRLLSGSKSPGLMSPILSSR
jgi:hypothetical protein